MFSQAMPYPQRDAQAGKLLSDFLPDRIFDAHAHLFDTALLPALTGNCERLIGGWEKYREEMSTLLRAPRQLRINAIPYPDSQMADRQSGLLQKSNAFVLAELNKCPDNVGEIMVHPTDTEDALEAYLTHPGIRGFKCYHTLSHCADSWNAAIGDFLPESAWAVANRKKLVITLHLVRDAALSDPENLRYIRQMAKKYPDAVLILAHCARAFAAWTAMESVRVVADLDNVWFDFSGVCESPAMAQILKTVGVKRCLWGSDYPVCRGSGKCISLGDSFYWISQKDLDNFSAKTPVTYYLRGTENLLAVRQAFQLTDLSESAVEDFFWNNAVTLFSR